MSGDDETLSTWLTVADPSATLRPEALAQTAVIHERLSGVQPVVLAFSETLGTGGMGLVRLAPQPRMGRTVAVKSLRRPQEGHAARLLEEAWVTGSLQHPSIVPIYDIAVDDAGDPHILMKRIEGIEWEAVIDDADEVAARFGARDLLQWNLGILVTVCNALAYAHSRGVLHRDLKPANVMIGSFGEVYLVDWGVAIAMDSTSERRIAGTPRYLAPEMVRGEHAGAATDVYLLGGVLHRILTGRPPHAGLTVDAILAGISTFAPTYDPEVPRGLAAIATRALQADPVGRFADVDAFRTAIATYLEQRPSLELTEQADVSHRSLEEHVARDDRMGVYEALAACRFGYTQALRTWPGNRDAQASWQRAVRTVVDFELTHGTPEGARLLLADLDAPDEALVARVEAAVEAWNAEQRRLHALSLDADLRIGARTRTFLVGSFGTLWIGAALWGYLAHGTVSADQQLRIALVSTLAVGVYLFWARRSLFATTTNRMTAGLTFIAPVCHALMALLLLILGAEAEVLATMDNFIFGLLALAAAITIDLRAWPAPVAFFAAAFASATLPAHGLLFQALALTVFTLTMLWMWLPGLPREPVYRDG